MSGVVDMINLNPSEPIEFSAYGGEGWYKYEIGELVCRGGALVFDLIDQDGGEREPIELELEQDGLYHWRDRDGVGHWCLFRAESATHIYLTGNWRSSDGDQGVSIFIWPKSEEIIQPEEQRPEEIHLKARRKAARKGKKTPKTPKTPGTNVRPTGARESVGHHPTPRASRDGEPKPLRKKKKKK